jgi:Mrp family chromosome partitioning ATPase
MLVGYARVSTDDQHLELQTDALTQAGCEKIFTDEISGAKSERPGLTEALTFMRQGDTLVVWRLDRLEAMLRELRHNYDLVVLDAPPVLAVSDTRLLAQLADTTVMVVRWGETRKDMVRLALQQLADVGVEVAGIVISMVDVHRNTQYGYADSDAFTGAYKRYYQN